MPVVTLPCRHCGQEHDLAWYLCRPCWFQLPAPVRGAIYSSGATVTSRRDELFAQIDAGVRLPEVVIS
jgi:hypothetical protein